ncbi:MAG: iron-siderophore ABC transporter substrate-binding protein [Cyanobacteria bacterium P01_G01_bin.19]
MRNQLGRFAKPFLLMILISILASTACNRGSDQKINIPSRESENTSECRAIQHRLGAACIPLEPERIIALDVPAILDPLLALDIKPVGTVSDLWGGGRYFPAVLPELVTGIESVGLEATPSLEKIAALKPDLILMPDHTDQSYQQLSAIAPTVLIDVFRDKIPIKENFRYIAQLVGKEEKAEEVLDQYQKRVEDFRKQLGDQLQNMEISAIAHYSNEFWVTPNNDSGFEVMKDIGLPIKPIFLEQDEWATFSIEVIDRYDADILFIIEDADEDGSTSYLSQEPLILSLEAVKNGRAYIVSPKIWTFGGPIGMNLFLDDLAKYLLEGKQDPHFEKS